MTSPSPKRSHAEFNRLLDIIARLRAPDGCPWDLKQSEASMTPHLLEEVYELMDAIAAESSEDSRDELGDVLMNVLMIAQIATEKDRYDLEAVAKAIADKLVRRHPHVFGDLKVDDADEVLRNWEAIKRREKGAVPRQVLAGVPGALPALLRAKRIGEKVGRVGFDWPDASGPREKLDEELRELDLALAAGDQRAIEHEVGDLLFSVVNIARHAGVNPETALRHTADRFIKRFNHVEEQLGEGLESASLAEMETAWQIAKKRT